VAQPVAQIPNSKSAKEISLKHNQLSSNSSTGKQQHSTSKSGKAKPEPEPLNLLRLPLATGLQHRPYSSTSSTAQGKGSTAAKKPSTGLQKRLFNPIDGKGKKPSKAKRNGVYLRPVSACPARFATGRINSPFFRCFCQRFKKCRYQYNTLACRPLHGLFHAVFCPIFENRPFAGNVLLPLII
jgi:hypothetical protein